MKRPLFIALVLSGVVLAAYWPLDHVTRVLNQNDNFWYVPSAMSLLDEGNLDLNEFEAPIIELAEDLSYLRAYYGEEDYRVMRDADGRVLNNYPVFTSIVALPFVAALKPMFRKQPNSVWVSIHMTLLIAKIYAAASVGLLFLVGWLIKAPYFFLAVGSKANIGGAASAPVVAAAFHPSLAPVGVLLAVLGYALGTYGAWLCAVLMQAAY